MAFRKLKYYDPNAQGVEPRADLEWMLNASNSVVCITPYRSFKEMITNDSSGVANTKMLGTVSNLMRSETIQTSTFFDIGNKKAIVVPGKTVGTVTIESGVFESINLLGLIYETLFSTFEKKYGARFKDVKQKILYTPKLNAVYKESEKQIYQNVNGTATAVPAVAASPGFEPETTSDGALLMSLTDIRTKLKFGLIIVFFQNTKRFQADFDIFDIDSELGGRVDPLESRSDIMYASGLSDKAETKYQIASGVFLEDCIITHYSSQIIANQAMSAPMESVSIMYTNARNIKQNLTLDPTSDPTVTSAGTNTPTTPPTAEPPVGSP